MAAIYERFHVRGETVWRVAIRVKGGRRFCLTFIDFQLAKEWLTEHEKWVKEDWDRAVEWREKKYAMMREKRLNEHDGILMKRFKQKRKRKKKNGSC